MALPVDRERLKRDHIKRLGLEEAVRMLADIGEARLQLSTLRGHLRHCEEACVLRGVLAMAENDLLEIVGHPRAMRVRRRPRGLSREGRPPGALVYGPKRSGPGRGRPPSYE